MSDTPIFTEADRAYAEPPGDKTPQPIDKTPQPKVVAATVGSGVGVALTTIIVWVVEVTANVDIPEGVELAAGVVLTAGLTFIGGYFKRG